METAVRSVRMPSTYQSAVPCSSICGLLFFSAISKCSRSVVVSWRSRYGAWRVYGKHDIGRGLPGGSVVRDMVTKVEIIAGSASLKQDMQSSGEHEFLQVVVGSEDEVSPVRNEIGEGSSPEDEQVTVVRAFPETGRTHQIRLHCQYLGLPLCGDIKYGGPLVWQGVSYDSHALHAESLAFTHPITNEPLHVVAPCPNWAADLGVKPFEFKSSE